MKSSLPSIVILLGVLLSGCGETTPPLPLITETLRNRIDRALTELDERVFTSHSSDDLGIRRAVKRTLQSATASSLAAPQCVGVLAQETLRGTEIWVYWVEIHPTIDGFRVYRGDDPLGDILPIAPELLEVCRKDAEAGNLLFLFTGIVDEAKGKLMLDALDSSVGLFRGETEVERCRAVIRLPARLDP